MRILIILYALILFSLSVSAIEFQKDTTFSEGNVRYTFIKGVEVDTFEITDGGIRIDDDEKIGITIQGGQLDVRIHKFDDNIREISFESSVPQTISFSITIDGKRNYLFDGETYHKDSYDISTEEVTFTISDFQVTDIDNVVDVNQQGDSIERLGWWEKKIFEVEVFSEENELGIIEGNSLSVTYLFATITFLIISIISILIWNIGVPTK